MKKVLIILFIILSAVSAAGSSLYKNDSVYNLSELLHASRFEYENGLGIKFPFNAWLQENIGSSCQAMKKVSPIKIQSIYENAVENHLSAYGDEEFDFEYSLSELKNELKSFSFVYECQDHDFKISYFSEDLVEIVSFIKP